MDRIFTLIFIIVSSISHASFGLRPAVVFDYSPWRYFPESIDHGAAEWMNPEFPDENWAEEEGGFCYLGGNDSTALENISSVFISTRFTVRHKTKIGKEVLNMDYNDGFIAYLKTTDITRANMPDGTPTYHQLSLPWHESLLPIIIINKNKQEIPNTIGENNNLSPLGMSGEDNTSLQYSQLNSADKQYKKAKEVISKKLSSWMDSNSTNGCNVTDVQDEFHKEEALVYPNPSTAAFHFQFGQTLHKASLRIYQLTGELLYSASVSGDHFQWNGQLSMGEAIKPGVYLYKIVKGNEVHSSGKLLKQ